VRSRWQVGSISVWGGDSVLGGGGLGAGGEGAVKVKDRCAVMRQTARCCAHNPSLIPSPTYPHTACRHAAAPGTTHPGWRDLTRSQHRIAKGDAQLDMTYTLSGGATGFGGNPHGPHAHARSAHGAPASASGVSAPLPPGAAPHHVSNEPLCELSLCICLARRLPVAALTRAVRSTFVPAEYPGSVAALYGSTPDEAPPQFYTDADVFRSLHEGMGDLRVPAWAASEEAFVRMHRWGLWRFGFRMHGG